MKKKVRKKITPRVKGLLKKKWKEERWKE